MTLAFPHDDKGALYACKFEIACAPHHEGRAIARPSISLCLDLHILRSASFDSSLIEADRMAQGACDATGAMGHDYSALRGFNGMGPDGAQQDLQAEICRIGRDPSPVVVLFVFRAL